MVKILQVDVIYCLCARYALLRENELFLVSLLFAEGFGLSSSRSTRKTTRSFLSMLSAEF